VLGVVSEQVPQRQNPEDYDEHRCLRWLNNFTQKHNQRLRWEVNRLRSFYPDVKLIYADYYGATMEFIKNPGKFGEFPSTVVCPPHSIQLHN
jgi:phospholipase/lecithinase/hemolysin